MHMYICSKLHTAVISDYKIKGDLYINFYFGSPITTIRIIVLSMKMSYLSVSNTIADGMHGNGMHVMNSNLFHRHHISYGAYKLKFVLVCMAAIMLPRTFHFFPQKLLCQKKIIDSYYGY